MNGTEHDDPGGGDSVRRAVRPPGKGERSFRVLLHWYPPGFRARYREDLVDFFRMERSRPEHSGVAGSARFWFRTLADLLRTGWTERRDERQRRRMTMHALDKGSRRGHTLPGVLADVRHAWRVLLRAPGYTALAVATFALGVGAAATVFSVVHGVLLTPLPMPDPERIVQVEERERDNPGARMTAWGNYADLRASGVFEELSAWTFGSVTWTGGRAARRLLAREVTASFFEVVGVAPTLGRPFTGAEQVEGEHHVVILSDGVWQSAFGGEQDVLGQSITLDGEPYTVIGVMPAGFDFPFGAEAWLPLRPVTDPVGLRRWHRHRMTGRLAPGVTLEAARAGAAQVAERLEQQNPVTNAGNYFAVTPQLDEYVSDARPALQLLLGAVGFLLLLACVNIAGLVAARSVTREREIGVRVALGATRGRLVRLVTAEALILGVAGGACGLLLALVGIEGVLKLAGDAIPRAGNIGLNVPVFVFAAIVSVASALVVSVMPAVRAVQRSGSENAFGSRTTDSPTTGAARRTLVVVQLALALVLTTGTVLLVRSFERMASVDPGIEADNVVTATIRLPAGAYPTPTAVARYFSLMLPELEAVPGVERAAATLTPPIDMNGWRNMLTIRSRPVAEADRPQVSYVVVSPGYFDAIGANVVAGRDFTMSDLTGGAPVAMVNRAAADLYWPDRGPLDDEILGSDEREGSWLRVVGIVSDVRQSLTEPQLPEVYVPIHYDRVLTFGLTVRTRPGTAAAVLRALPDVIAARDRDVPIIRLGLLTDRLDLAVAGPRFNAWLMSVFAALALVLSCIGTYGVLAGSVAARRREIGIRTALGAVRNEVVALVVRDAATIAAGGILLGLAGAFATARLLSGLLFDIEPTDPASLAVVVLVIALVALGSAVRPAMQAASVDPVEALRRE